MNSFDNGIMKSIIKVDYSVFTALIIEMELTRLRSALPPSDLMEEYFSSIIYDFNCMKEKGKALSPNLNQRQSEGIRLLRRGAR